MIQKMIKVLCLVLALALPLAATAETQHILKIIPGDELASEEMVKDVLDILSLTLTEGTGKSGALTLTLNDTDVATLALGADETGLYVQSNLLSDDVLYVTWEDVSAFLADMMKAAVEARARAYDVEANEEVVAALEEAMAQYKKQMTAAIAIAAENKDDAMTVKTPEEISAMAEKLFEDDPEMATFIKEIYDNMTVEEGDFSDDARDPATQKYTMSMTGEDYAAICDTAYMRSMVKSIVSQNDAGLEGDELEAETDKLLDGVRKIYEESDIAMTITVYSADEGRDVVGMEMGMSMAVTEEDTGDEEPETVKVAMNMNYDRLTGENGPAYTADLSMEVSDQNMMQMTFGLLKGKDGVSDGMLAALANHTQITFLYHGENKGDKRIRSLAIYGRNGATAITEPAAAERPVITFQLTSGEGGSGLLSDIEKATPDTAVNVMKLSVDEMQDLAVDVQTRAMQALFTALGQMPASVQQLFISQR